MCRAGGPRCPQTPGKRARRKFNDRVNKVVQESGLANHDWKEKNVDEYDKMLRQTFDLAPVAATTDSTSDDDDTSWVNYREIGTKTSGGSEDTPDYSDDGWGRVRDVDYSDSSSYGGVSEDDYLEHGSFWASAGYDPYSKYDGTSAPDDNDDVDYSDLVSDDPDDVNAFLAKEFEKEIQEAIKQGTPTKEEVAEKSPDPTAPVISSWGSSSSSWESSSYYDDDDDGVKDQSVDGDEEDWEWERKTRPDTNAHLLPKDAVIHSPNPNPVFVYGTLRTGNGNYRNVLEGHTQKEQTGARLPGTSMYTNGGFPYVLEEDDGQGVTGDLMYLDYDDLADTMQNLDWLEGTGDDLRNDHNHYNRHLRYVQTGDNEYVQAWVYMPPDVDRGRISSLRKVETGDWANRISPRA